MVKRFLKLLLDLRYITNASIRIKLQLSVTFKFVFSEPNNLGKTQFLRINRNKSACTFCALSPSHIHSPHTTQTMPRACRGALLYFRCDITTSVSCSVKKWRSLTAGNKGKIPGKETNSPDEEHSRYEIFKVTLLVFGEILRKLLWIL